VLDWLKDESNWVGTFTLGVIKGASLLAVFALSIVTLEVLSSNQEKARALAHKEPAIRASRSISKESLDTLSLSGGAKITNLGPTEVSNSEDRPDVPGHYIGEFRVEGGRLIPKYLSLDQNRADLPEKTVASWGDARSSAEKTSPQNRSAEKARTLASTEHLEAFFDKIGNQNSIGRNATSRVQTLEPVLLSQSDRNLPKSKRQNVQTLSRTLDVAEHRIIGSKHPISRAINNQEKNSQASERPVSFALNETVLPSREMTEAQNPYHPPVPLAALPMSLEQRLEQAYRIADSMRNDWSQAPGPTLARSERSEQSGLDEREFTSETGARIIIAPGSTKSPAEIRISAENGTSRKQPNVSVLARDQQMPKEDNPKTPAPNNSPSSENREPGTDSNTMQQAASHAAQETCGTERLKEAFSFEEREAYLCDQPFSLEGVDSGERSAQGWIQLKETASGASVLYHSMDGASLSFLTDRTRKLLEYHAGQVFDASEGLIYGPMNSGFKVSVQNQDYRIMYFDHEYKRTTDPTRASAYLIFGILPGLVNLKIERADGLKGVAHIPVKTNIATYLPVQELEARFVRGYVYDESGQISGAQAAPVLISLVGDAKKWERTGANSYFDLGKLYTLPQSAIYLDVVEAFNPYMARHRVAREEVKPVSLYRISAQQVTKWNTSLEGGVTPTSGYVLGIPRTENVRLGLLGPVTWSLGILATLKSANLPLPETYTITADDRLEAPAHGNNSGETFSLDSRFLSVEVSDGLVLPTATSQDQIQYQEMRPSGPRVINVVRYDFGIQ